MTYESLLNEAYLKGIIVKEKPLKYNDGRIDGNNIAIRSSIDTSMKKACTLAEEIGHYELTVGDILDLKDMANLKQEYKARRWSYHKLLPIDDIVTAASNGYTTIWNIAEYLDVDEPFFVDCLKHYGILDI